LAITDLSEFLQARLDEDEGDAALFHEFTCPARGFCRCLVPRQILDHVAIRRRIVRGSERRLRSHDPRPATVSTAWQTLGAFALPYEQHPRWREYWRP
jgi:hypothetical protein